MHTLETDTNPEFATADTSVTPEDYLFLRGSINDIVKSIPESSEVEREAALRAAVERLLDGSEAVEDVLAQKIREMFELNRSRTETIHFSHVSLGVKSFVTHDRSGKGVGEKYTIETDYSPNLMHPITKYEVTLEDGRKSRVVIDNVKSENAENGNTATMKIYDDSGEGEAEVHRAEAQREVYKALLYEILLTAKTQDRRKEADRGEQELHDDDARRLLMERDESFAYAMRPLRSRPPQDDRGLNKAIDAELRL